MRDNFDADEKTRLEKRDCLEFQNERNLNERCTIFIKGFVKIVDVLETTFDRRAT